MMKPNEKRMKTLGYKRVAETAKRNSRNSPWRLGPMCNTQKAKKIWKDWDREMLGDDADYDLGDIGDKQ